MAASRSRAAVVEFGDFQTPAPLASLVVAHLARRGLSPASLVEPTCGTGAFVAAAIDGFPSLRQIAAFDINPDYVEGTRARLRGRSPGHRCETADFFTHDWTGT